MFAQENPDGPFFMPVNLFQKFQKINPREYSFHLNIAFPYIHPISISDEKTGKLNNQMHNFNTIRINFSKNRIRKIHEINQQKKTTGNLNFQIEYVMKTYFKTGLPNLLNTPIINNNLTGTVAHSNPPFCILG